MDARVLSAANSHIGRIRSSNQDSGYAGTHLFLVADGMGGHAGGDIASSLATQAITAVADERYPDVESAKRSLVEAVVGSANELTEAVSKYPDLAGMGTTVSALIRYDDKVAIAHIGDSRIYLFRDGKLSAVTKDHTFVQKLVDSGRITPEEAAVHPRRNVLMRVLGDIEGAVEVDSMILDTRPDDRWLLCSDGLFGYVEETEIEEVLESKPDAVKAGEALIDAALDRGAPDNVTVVVVGVNETNLSAAAKPQLVGAASAPLNFEAETRAMPAMTARLFYPPRMLGREEHYEPAGFLETLIAEDKQRALRRRLRWALWATVTVSLVIGFAIYGYVWTQSQYFVGADDDSVVVYQGVNGDILGIPLHTVIRDTEIPLDSLPEYVKSSVVRTIQVISLNQADLVIQRISDVAGND